jgi:hypothetical protein
MGKSHKPAYLIKPASASDDYGAFRFKYESRLMLWMIRSESASETNFTRVRLIRVLYIQ